jgi:hypothetical protein
MLLPQLVAVRIDADEFPSGLADNYMQRMADPQCHRPESLCKSHIAMQAMAMMIAVRTAPPKTSTRLTL